MKHWQKGLISFRFLSGTQGQEGAKMELNYQMRKRDVVLLEIIIKRNFPFEFHVTYDAKGVHTNQRKYFRDRDIDAKTTKWISGSEFQLSGFIII